MLAPSVPLRRNRLVAEPTGKRGGRSGGRGPSLPWRAGIRSPGRRPGSGCTADATCGTLTGASARMRPGRRRRWAARRSLLVCPATSTRRPTRCFTWNLTLCVTNPRLSRRPSRDRSLKPRLEPPPRLAPSKLPRRPADRHSHVVIAPHKPTPIISVLYPQPESYCTAPVLYRGPPQNCGIMVPVDTRRPATGGIAIFLLA